MQDMPRKTSETAAPPPPKTPAPAAKAAIPSRAKSALAAVWRWRWRAMVAAMLALVVWYVGVPAALGPVVAVDPVVETEFVQTVVASGHVEAPYRVSIGSQMTGIVADVPVEEGQTVKAGDVLVRLDDSEARAAVVLAEGAVAQSEARMRQMQEFTLPSAREGLRQARATLLAAEQAYERTARLAKTGVATKATLDDATRARDVAQAQVRNAELQVATNEPGGSDYVMAQALLNQSRASLATAQSRLGYTVIRAPRDGVLISRSVERGNVVQPSTVLMVLSPFVETQLVVQIDEKNFGLIALGQKALASADAFPKESFPAEVAYINPGIDLQRASVQVKLNVPHAPAYLRQDMTVSVDIETARHPGALIVPMASVRGLSGDKPFVLKVVDGRAQRQPVKLGLIGAGRAEILDGLKAGDLVIPPTAKAVEDGSRLRARPRTGAPT